MLPETVLVLEVLLTVLAHLWLLGSVLCPYMAPEVYRGDDQLAVTALRPLCIGAIRCGRCVEREDMSGVSKETIQNKGFKEFINYYY